ncbi:MAG: HAD-IA family hydrolase [Rhodothermia bacterium]|nr:HAD-IA family hydrolase [Rhodothermia bacterium]
MSQKFQFVYFDLDDTLLNHRRAERHALLDLSRRLWDGKSESYVSRLRDSYHARNRELWHAYADGEIDRLTLQELRIRHLIDEFNIRDTTWQDLDKYYMAQYAVHWQEVDGARAAFEAVAERVKVGLITNGFADVQHAKLERFPVFRQKSSAVVISEEVGVLKPDRRLFERAEEMAGVSGDAILYVGDSYRSDVLGAVAAGWVAAWFSEDREREMPERSFAFSDWSELLVRI